MYATFGMCRTRGPIFYNLKIPPRGRIFRELRQGEIHHIPANDLAGFHVVNHVIQLAQRPGLHDRHGLAFCRELECFAQILAGTDQGADHNNTIQHRFDDVQLHVALRQGNAHEPAHGPQGFDGGIEGGLVHRRNYGGMDPADFVLDDLNDIIP